MCVWNFLLTVCWKLELLGSQEMIADVEVMFVAWNKKLNSLSLIDLFSMFANVWWMCCGWEYSLICFWHVSCVWKGRLSKMRPNEAKGFCNYFTAALLGDIVTCSVNTRPCCKFENRINLWYIKSKLAIEKKTFVETKMTKAKIWWVEVLLWDDMSWNQMTRYDKTQRCHWTAFAILINVFFMWLFHQLKVKRVGRSQFPSDSPGNVFGCENRQEGGSRWVATVSRRFLNAWQAGASQLNFILWREVYWSYCREKCVQSWKGKIDQFC